MYTWTSIMSKESSGAQVPPWSHDHVSNNGTKEHSAMAVWSKRGLSLISVSRLFRQSPRPLLCFEWILQVCNGIELVLPWLLHGKCSTISYCTMNWDQPTTLWERTACWFQHQLAFSKHAIIAERERKDSLLTWNVWSLDLQPRTEWIPTSFCSTRQQKMLNSSWPYPPWN